MILRIKRISEIILIIPHEIGKITVDTLKQKLKKLCQMSIKNDRLKGNLFVIYHTIYNSVRCK